MKRPIAILAVLSALAISNKADAAAAGGAIIYADGKEVAGYVDSFPDGPIDPSWAAPLLGRLEGVALKLADSHVVVVDPKDDTKATLKGKIKVSASFRGREIATAKTDKLGLVKRDGEWYVSGKEIDRIMVAAGAKAPEKVVEQAPEKKAGK